LAATLLRPAARAGTILAFDFGTRRIGVAVGETTLGLAHPLATIAAGGDDDRLAAIAALVREWQPALLVVERYTTEAASAALSDAGVGERGHKPLRDQVAAQIILQAYLDQRTRA
jgi:putative Holliday junction resolvase